MNGLREHLLKESFSSVDLVNVFGRRCYTIGRWLNLITEEDYDNALKEAEIKDYERRKALENNMSD